MEQDSSLATSAVEEPSAAVLAKCSRAMRWNIAEACWVWVDETRRRWDARPTISVVLGAAVRQYGAKPVAKKLEVAPQTVLAIIAGTALMMSSYTVGHRLGQLRDLTEELEAP